MLLYTRTVNSGADGVCSALEPPIPATTTLKQSKQQLYISIVKVRVACIIERPFFGFPATAELQPTLK
jgi:hypothetical protein